MIIKFYPLKDHRSNSVLDLYSSSFSFIFIIFIPCIIKIDNREIPKENEIQKRKWLHFFALVGAFIIYMVGKSLPLFINGRFISGNVKVINPLSEGPFTYVGVDMILMNIATIIIFKNKYYIHHLIAIIGFILFGNISDIFLDY